MEKIRPILRFPEFKGDFEYKKLEEFTQWSSGGTPSKDNSNYWQGEIPWISASSMKGTEYSDSELKITNEGLKKGSRLAKKGDLLLLVRGSMLFNKIPIGIAGIDVAFNQDLKSISVNDKISFSMFILQWFFSQEPKILNMVTGTGIGAGKLDLKDLRDLLINLPSLPEQTKIAHFLTSVDEKLNLLKEKKEALEEYKKGMMQKIFSQEIRFKDENGDFFTDWEEKQIKEIFQVTRGTVLSMTMVKELKHNDFIYPVYSSQTKNKGLAGYFNSYLFEDAITWTTDGAGAGDVKYRKGKFYCTNVCGVLLNDEGYCNLLIAEILNSVSRNYVSYVGNPKLMNNVMSEISIIIPSSIKEQTKIANFLSAIDEKIELVVNQIDDTQVYKKGLLQLMFC